MSKLGPFSISSYLDTASECTSFSAMLGLVLLHLAVESRSPEIRRTVIKVLEVATAQMPELVNKLVTSSLTIYFSRAKSSSLGIVDEGAEDSSHVVRRLPAFALASAAFDESCDQVIRESCLVNLSVLAHHPLLGASGLDWCADQI